MKEADIDGDGQINYEVLQVDNCVKKCENISRSSASWWAVLAATARGTHHGQTDINKFISKSFMLWQILGYAHNKSYSPEKLINVQKKVRVGKFFG